MEFIPNYARKKEGKEKINYISDDLKDILAPTYGILIYQEQINSIAMKMAGFSLGEADMFRRAVSKKDKTILLSLQDQFVKGCKNKGYPENVAKREFQDILKFANYGFNKSHSVVYSIIACRMAWLKVHYPLEFYAALLGTSSAASDSKFSEYISEMNSLGLKMLPPSINNSGTNFTIVKDGLLFPLTAIKEINIGLVEKIIVERTENGAFKDFFDFTLRMFKYKINENHLNALISSGAFDELYPSRASMHLNVRSALQYAELNYSDDGQLSIGIDAFPKPVMKLEKDDPLINLNKEYEVIGIMLSDSPLTYKQDILKQHNAIKIVEAKEMDNATIAGIVKSKKVINTKKGTQMAFIKIFDETGDIEVTAFSKQYSESSSLLEKNKIVLMDIKQQINKDEVTFIAEKIRGLEEENNG